MSRSYKKHMVFKEENSKFGKKQAVKCVRHYKDHLPKGGTYKKLYCSWNICDYRTYSSCKNFFEEELKPLKKGTPEYKACYKNWLKWCKGK